LVAWKYSIQFNSIQFNSVQLGIPGLVCSIPLAN
jgi:hypothetical protein